MNNGGLVLEVGCFYKLGRSWTLRPAYKVDGTTQSHSTKRVAPLSSNVSKNEKPSFEGFCSTYGKRTGFLQWFKKRKSPLLRAFVGSTGEMSNLLFEDLIKICRVAVML